jgi:hypothetical protein
MIYGVTLYNPVVYLAHVQMHEAWAIVSAHESFWEQLDNVMRGVTKQIKDEFMDLSYTNPVLYKRLVRTGVGCTSIVRRGLVG